MRAAAMALAGGLLFAPALAFGQNAGAAYFEDRQRVDGLIEAGDGQGAFDLVQALNRRNGGDALQWWTEGRLAASLEQWDVAAAALTRSYDLGTTYPAITARRIAEAHARAGRADGALAWLERALGHGLARRFALLENPAFAAYADDARFIAAAGRASEPVAERAERWRRDIDFFVAEAQRMHASPERPAFSIAFLSAAEALKARARDLTDTEMVLQLQRLAAGLGDGHSYVMMGAPTEGGLQPIEYDARQMPVFFHPFGEDVYVIDGVGEARALIGGRVTAIGDTPTAALVERARPYLHADNSETWKFIGLQFALRGLAFHQTLGTARGDRVALTVEMANGRCVTARLRAGDFNVPRKLRPMPGQRNVALFLTRLDDLYWSHALAEHDALFVQINNFRNAREGESLRAFAARTVDEARAGGVGNLIVDFRRNNGDDNSLCDGLLRALMRLEAGGGRLFVITRHETFSAA